MTPIVVFDCMIFLQGAARPNSPARACFRIVEDRKVTLCVSAEIMTEIRDVLTRPKTLKRFPQLTAAWANEFVQNAESKAVLMAEVPKLFTFERDPKDEPYLNLALAANATYLVSQDNDLLDLMNDKEFRERHPALTILNAPAFLQAISEKNQSVPSSDS